MLRVEIFRDGEWKRPGGPGPTPQVAVRPDGSIRVSIDYDGGIRPPWRVIWEETTIFERAQ